MAGYLTGTVLPATWRTKYGNMTYDQLQDAVYGAANSHYTSLQVFQGRQKISQLDFSKLMEERPIL